MAERSNYQKKVIQRYYDNLQGIALAKLGELVSELYLASEAQEDRLWKRVAQQMANLKVPDQTAQHILARRDVQLLARHVQDWGRTPPT